MYKLPSVITIRFSGPDRAATEALITEHFPDMPEGATGKEILYRFLNRATAAAPQAAPNPDTAHQPAAIADFQDQVVSLSQHNDEQAEKMQMLRNEIGRLKIRADFDAQQIANLKELHRAEPTGQTTAAPATLGEYEEVITFDPIFAMLVDIERAEAQRKRNKTQSRAQVLKNLFLDMVKRSDAYPLSKLYSASDLRAVAEKVKQQQTPSAL